MLPYIHIYNINISTYTLCAIFGIIASLIVVILVNRKYAPRIMPSDIVIMMCYVFVGVIFGAKLFQIIGIIAKSIINHNSISLHSLLNGIGVFYGGLIGGFISLASYSKVYRVNLFEVCNAFVPGVLLFHSIGRVGCFLVGCCYGKEAEWGIAFFSSMHAPNGVKLIPVQLFGSFLNFVFFILLLATNHAKKSVYELSFPLYLILYAVCRFFLEFFRGDESRGVYILSISQWISIPIFILGICLLLYLSKKISNKTKC